MAIKRIKASCFAGRPSERERLVHSSVQRTFFFYSFFSLMNFLVLPYYKPSLYLTLFERRHLVLIYLVLALNVDFLIIAVSEKVSSPYMPQDLRKT